MELNSKDFGLALTALGIIAVAYEYWASYCSKRLAELCYYPFSPSFPGVVFPLYSVIILVFGVLLFIGSKSDE